MWLCLTVTTFATPESEVTRHLSPTTTRTVGVLDDLQENEKMILAAIFMTEVSKGILGA